MAKLNENGIDNVYNDDMAKAKKDFQVNIRVNEDDLALIDAKAKRLGWNRSQFIKIAALNVEITVQMQEQLLKPKL
jgi:uncharacterized protein (DUF1778 family)